MAAQISGSDRAAFASASLPTCALIALLLWPMATNAILVAVSLCRDIASRRLSPMGGPAADRRLITLCTSDPNLSHVERGISRDFAARQSECDERILRHDGRHDLFSATAKGPAPCSFNPGELSKGRGKVASVSYRLSSRRSSESRSV